MRLSEIILTIFRSFGPTAEKVSLSDLTALVGTNASGKTAFLHALQRLFGVSRAERELRPEDFHVPRQLDPADPAPIAALGFEKAYYDQLARTYQEKRDLMLRILGRSGFRCYPPQGAYYVMTEHPTHLGIQGDDVAFARYRIEKVGVATVPGSSFYRPGAPEGRTQIRFCFPKKEETLQQAGRRLSRLAR